MAGERIKHIASFSTDEIDQAIHRMLPDSNIQKVFVSTLEDLANMLEALLVEAPSIRNCIYIDEDRRENIRQYSLDTEMHGNEKTIQSKVIPSMKNLFEECVLPKTRPVEAPPLSNCVYIDEDSEEIVRPYECVLQHNPPMEAPPLSISNCIYIEEDSTEIFRPYNLDKEMPAKEKTIQSKTIPLVEKLFEECVLPQPPPMEAPLLSDCIHIDEDSSEIIRPYDLDTEMPAKEKTNQSKTIPSVKKLFEECVLPQIESKLSMYEQMDLSGQDSALKITIDFRNIINFKEMSLQEMKREHSKIISQLHQNMVPNIDLAVKYCRGLLYLAAYKQAKHDNFKIWFREEFGVVYATALRYMTVARLLMKYPLLLICDLSFAQLLKHNKQLHDFLRTEAEGLKERLGQTTPVRAQKQGPAMALRQEVRAGSIHLKDRLSIELQPDNRKGAIRYGNDYFSAKMVDMPCIIECHKTVDMKTFYKTADVSQVMVQVDKLHLPRAPDKMLITTTEEDAVPDETESPKKKDKDKRFFFTHGLTPPLKNVRKRRFRKTLKKKYMDQPDIEKEVKRLFRTDAEATSVSWELITEDEKPSGDSGDLESAGTSQAGGFSRTNTAASLDIDIFGELSDSDDEEEKDVNIVDSEDEESRQQSFLNMDMSAASTSVPDAYLGLDGSLSQSQAAQDSFLGIKMESGLKMETEVDPDMYTEMDEPLDDVTSHLKEEMKQEDSNYELMT